MWIFFCLSILHATDVKTDIKQSVVDYLRRLPFQQYGTESIRPIYEIESKLAETEFVHLPADNFNQRFRTRRSAFYSEGLRSKRIYLNSTSVPSPGLLVHELIADRQYEISALFETLIRIRERTDWSDHKRVELSSTVKIAIDVLVDRFGWAGRSNHQWEVNELQSIRRNNSRLAALGGDIIGGGGDQIAFSVKSQVLLMVAEKLSETLSSELGWEARRVQQHVANILFLLSVKVVFETDHARQGVVPQVRFGTDGIEGIAFFPYWIILSPQTDIISQSQHVVDALINSDLFWGIPSFYKNATSPCACFGNRSSYKLARCPDPAKVNSGMADLIAFYQQDYERRESCRISISGQNAPR